MNELRASVKVLLEASSNAEFRRGNTFTNDSLKQAQNHTAAFITETASSAIHHLYQDLFITDLKKEVSQQTAEYQSLRITLIEKERENEDLRG